MPDFYVENWKNVVVTCWDKGDWGEQGRNINGFGFRHVKFEALLVDPRGLIKDTNRYQF